MSSPTPDQFAEFYKAVHGYAPFPWQSRLAAQVCGGSWPKAIALPTAAGKTACLDVAVFALACGAPAAPRRIFFVVDRRIVVDQAYWHAQKLAKCLARAADGVLREVADRLRDIADPGWLEQLESADRDRILAKRWAIQDENDPKKRQELIRKLSDDECRWWETSPLDVYVLRGGMYRETAWTRSPLQPLVVASTVDQVGSRLLFRGYGVSDSMKPVHAGLVGNDALILLDEAHCAKPFLQTATSVEKYREWNDLPAPFTFVSITATPSEEVRQAEIERKKDRPGDPKLIEEAETSDLADKVLGKRIKASKLAKLATAKKNKLLDELKTHAETLMGVDLGTTTDKDGNEVHHTVRAVGVIVNRVKTARELAKMLREVKAKKGEQPPPRRVILLTGRMRPLDRDAVLRELDPLFSGSKTPLDVPTFVVATQCLEVGADLDFHALVTECASLDALRQRFGRLNRVATRPSAPAVIVCREEYTEPKDEEKSRDPIYGNSLPHTWQFLRGPKDDRTEFDFGVDAVRKALESIPDDKRAKLLEAANAPTADAPVLFPAHLDCWVQTHPIPTPDPDVALFLHGPKQTGQPDVQVVLRNDLRPEWTDEQIKQLWRRINPDPGSATPPVSEMREEVYEVVVSLCPPSSSEAVAVPISVFRDWVLKKPIEDETGDTTGGAEEPEARREENEQVGRFALLWRGEEENRMVRTKADVIPNATYVIGVPRPDDEREQTAIRRIADLPDVLSDFADAAFQQSRDKGLLRLTSDAIADWPDEFRIAGVRELAALSGDIDDRDEFAARLDEVLDDLSAVNTDTDKLRPWAWIPRAAKALARPGTERQRKPTRWRECGAHPCGGVVLTGKIRLGQFDPTYLDDSEPTASFKGRAVSLDDHSAGVADYARRFAEGCRLNADLYHRAGLYHDLGKLDRRFQAMLKQGSPRTAVGTAWAKSAKSLGSPKERAEARLVHLYPKGARHELLSAAIVGRVTGDDLLLHLIATHHGSARPFADPVEENDAAGSFKVDSLGLTAEARQDIAAWNAELPERFWRVVRTLGWWGTAYREAVFRLADHAQSRAEQEAEWQPTAKPESLPSSPSPTEPRRLYPLALTGLDGSNPLAYLAALGMLRCLTAFARQPDRPSWLDGEVRLSWGRPGASSVAVLHLPGKPSEDAVSDYLAGRLAIAVPDLERRLEMAKDVLDSVPEQLEKYLTPLESDQRAIARKVISTVVTEQLKLAAPDLSSFRKRPDEVKRGLAKQYASICPKSELGKKVPGKVKELLDEQLDRELYDHPAALAVALVEGKEVAARDRFIRIGRTITAGSRDVADWAVAHHSELVPDEGSQLLIVRSDYLRGNLLGVFQGTSADHIRRAVFAQWDYADGLDNQSLHWEPSEDRRHAYQWHKPNGDPTKADRGGMLGANRLALEAWPYFLSVPHGEKLRTRGFRGTGMFDTFWTWPLWASCLTPDGVASILSLPALQTASVTADTCRGYGVSAVFRSQRILVGKTPNLTAAVATG